MIKTYSRINIIVFFSIFTFEIHAPEKLAWFAVNTSFNFSNTLNTFWHCDVRVSFIKSPASPYLSRDKSGVRAREKVRYACFRLDSAVLPSMFHYVPFYFLFPFLLVFLFFSLSLFLLSLFSELSSFYYLSSIFFAFFLFLFLILVGRNSFRRFILGPVTPPPPLTPTSVTFITRRIKATKTFLFYCGGERGGGGGLAESVRANKSSSGLKLRS